MTNPVQPDTTVHEDLLPLNAVPDGEDGAPRRPRLTMGIDVRTRAIVGWSVRFEGNDAEAG